ncbi:MAG: hypothetical protein ABH880_00925 [Patescibacteria group bacterium]
MKKIVIILASLIAIAWLGEQVYQLQKERLEFSEEYKEVKDAHEEIEEDNQRLLEKIEYLSEPRNLEKEIRAKFNYKHPEEKLIIVVPEEEGATSTDE